LAQKRMAAEQRKRSIIEATIRVVARMNYDSATTALIAKEAGINEALIYKHFKNKQELHLAVLDYLLEYRLKIYATNPVFQERNKDQSIIKALNVQYLERIQSPDVDMFSCILKAFFAIDPKIREKGWAFSKAFHEFIKRNLIEDNKRGFFNGSFDPEVVAWEIQGTIILISTLAVIDRLDAFGIQNIKKSQQYFETLFMHKKPKTRRK
jgi:AcrR family transcriptional regulator